MDGIIHIVSPLSASWCGWVMLGLLLCAVLSEWLQPGVITQAPASLLASTERTYKESPMTFWGQFFISLFRIGTLAMVLNLCLSMDGVFSFARYGVVCALVVGMFLVKMVCNISIDYTFMLSRRFGDMYEHYGNIMTLAVLVLYPVALVLMRIGDPVVGQWALGIVAGLFVAMWIYRSARVYVTSPLAVVYLLLYIGTVEILLCGVLYFLSAKLVMII